MKRKMFDPARGPDDLQAAAVLRPRTLEEFIGQREIKAQLQISITAARNRGDSLDHVILHGHPGLGKTTLANILSVEMGAGFKSTSGPVIMRAGDLAGLLSNLEQGDVLFIDEIHRLPPSVEEILYPAMEEFLLDVMVGQGPGSRAVRIELPRFTLVGATTRLGLLTSPLRDRFGIQLKLDFYLAEDLTAIVRRAAEILNVQLTDDGALEIARRSRGTPRIAGRLLRRVRDFAEVAGKQAIDRETADQALLIEGIDRLGLDRTDRRILEILCRDFLGGPVGLTALAATLGEEAETLVEVCEPYLVKEGFIVRTRRGRVATAKAWRHLGIEPPVEPGSGPQPGQ
ncbi:MAG: Holliday junction branch migration DNA helicase RuvB [Deltaproteobacteria bacterium]|jgi:Holliday junction DNA helicase RuvB|nr:Holliday junction branch migration DNA helicase RuvB [Deltaproteobacteria bacterium]